MWTDEIASVKLAEQPIELLWSSWMRRETNPPLYYTLLHFWLAWVGGSDNSLRWLSWLCGAGAIPLAAQLATKLGGRRTGALAALLVATAPGHIYYSQEIRGYALGHTLAMAALFGFVGFMREENSQARRQTSLALYTVTATCAAYVHTLLVALPLLVNLVYAYRLIDSRRYLGLSTWLLANLVFLILWAWWLTITWWQLQHPANLAWLTRPQPWLAARYVLEAYVPEGPAVLRGIVTAAIIAGFVLGCLALRNKAGIVLPVIALGAPVLLYLVSWVTPVMLPRTIYWAQGALAVTVALGLGNARYHRLGTGIALMIVAAGIAGAIDQRDHVQKEPWRRVVALISARTPVATVIAGGPHVAYLLSRYCTLPQCNLRIRTLSEASETWSAGLPRPRQIKLVDLHLLGVSEPTVISVVRGNYADPAAVLEPLAQPTSIPLDTWTVTPITITRWSFRKR